MSIKQHLLWMIQVHTLSTFCFVRCSSVQVCEWIKQVNKCILYIKWVNRIHQGRQIMHKICVQQHCNNKQFPTNHPCHHMYCTKPFVLHHTLTYSVSCGWHAISWTDWQQTTTPALPQWHRQCAEMVRLSTAAEMRQTQNNFVTTTKWLWLLFTVTTCRLGKKERHPASNNTTPAIPKASLEDCLGDPALPVPTCS